MIKIKQWLISIIAVSISAGMMDILLPTGKTKKAFRVISGIVMLYVFLLPVKNVDEESLLRSFTFDRQEAEESLQSQYDMTVIDAYQKGIENAITKSLQDENIITDKIEIECKMQNGEIAIKKITVTVKTGDSDTENIIRKIISEKCNLDTEIEIKRG